MRHVLSPAGQGRRPKGVDFSTSYSGEPYPVFIFWRHVVTWQCIHRHAVRVDQKCVRCISRASGVPSPNLYQDWTLLVQRPKSATRSASAVHGVPSPSFGQSCAPFGSRQAVAVHTPQTPLVHAKSYSRRVRQLCRPRRSIARLRAELRTPLRQSSGRGSADTADAIGTCRNCTGTLHDARYCSLLFHDKRARRWGNKSRRKRDVLPHTHGNDFRVARATTRAIYTVLGSVAFTRAKNTAWHRKPWNLHTMKKGGRAGKKKTKGRSEESLKNRDLQIFRVQWLTFTGHIE